MNFRTVTGSLSIGVAATVLLIALQTHAVPCKGL